jgi:hypothetical protein
VSKQANLRSLVKGQSGNPKGRPVSKPLVDLIRQALAEKTAEGLPKAWALARTLVDTAVAGDITAIREVLLRVDGRIPHAVAVENAGALLTVDVIALAEEIHKERERRKRSGEVAGYPIVENRINNANPSPSNGDDESEK